MKKPYTVEIVGQHFSKGADGKIHGTCKVVAKGVDASTGAAVWFCQ